MHKNLRLLTWFNFCLDFRPYGPIAILYFSQVSGSFVLGMSVFSVMTLSSALLEVPTGIFSDRIGRKRTLVLGALVSVLSVVSYASGTYWMLLVGAGFEGLSRAFFSGNNDALLHDTLAENGLTHEFQEWLGKTSSMFQFAATASAILGALLSLWSFAAVMWVSVIPQVIGLIITLRFDEPKIHSRHSGNVYLHLRDAARSILHNPRLRLLSAAAIWTYAIGEAAFQFRASFIATLWPLWAVSLARLLSHLTAAMSYYFSGRLIRRFGEYPLLLGGIFYGETVNLLSLLFPGVLSPLMMGTTSIFHGVKVVSLGGLMQREFTDEQRATMGSLTSFVANIAFAVFSLILGWLADRIGAGNALLMASILSFVPVLFYRLTFRAEAAKLATAEG